MTPIVVEHKLVKIEGNIIVAGALLPAEVIRPIIVVGRNWRTVELMIISIVIE